MRFVLVAFAVTLLAACATPRSTASSGPAVTPPVVQKPRERRQSARALFDVCWPEFGSSAQRVVLTFIQSRSELKDVVFEAVEGAPNSTGRCMQEIAWQYPWRRSEIPATLSLSPPEVRPSGWTYLDYVALLGESLPRGGNRGIADPAPLIRVCLDHEGFRPHIRYRVQTQPVRVSVFSEVSRIEDPAERRTESDAATTDAERCVQAVLASTDYATAKDFEFEFSDISGAPAPAPDADVALYFAKPGLSEMPLPGEAVHEGLAHGQAAVGACWEAALQRRAGLFGARSVRVAVDASGHVTSAQVVSNRSTSRDEAVDYLLDRCLVEAVRAVKFEASAPASFTYSWVFARR